MSDLYPVKDQIRQRAHIGSMEEYERLYRLSIDNPEWFWAEQAKTLTWYHPWTTVFDADYDEIDFAWFSGGRLNACYNCVDRHLERRGDQTALIWEGDDPADDAHITYRELHEQVCRLANVLKSRNVSKGDRVCIYMPMIPEAVYAMLACARIGAVLSILGMLDIPLVVMATRWFRGMRRGGAILRTRREPGGRGSHPPGSRVIGRRSYAYM